MTVECQSREIHAVQEHERALAPLYAELLDALGVQEGSRYLEAGCAAGYACQLAAARGAEVSGFDTRVPLLEVALDRVPLGDFRVGTLERAPFAPRSFTRVAAFCALHRAVDRLAALRVLELLGIRRATLAVCSFGDPDELARLLPAAGYEIEELGERELVLRYTDEASAREELERAGWLGAADIGGGGPVVLHQRLSY